MISRENILDHQLREATLEIERLNNIIKEAREFIKEHCIDDEFYVNLTNKEKYIIDVLEILDKGE